MPEPVAPLLATGGLTLFGILTGMHPTLLAAGFIGCWWYNSYLPELALRDRISSGIIAALVATWSTPPLILWLTSLAAWPPAVTADAASFMAALAVGFLTHKVIGPALLRHAQKKTEEIA